MEWNKLSDLVRMLKVFTENTKMLHRYIKGPEFLAAHELLSDIYTYSDDVVDEIVEMFIPLGFFEPVIRNTNDYNFIRVMDYSVEEAIILTFNGLNKILLAIFYFKEEELPAYIVSKLEEYEYDLNVFCYKIERIIT